MGPLVSLQALIDDAKCFETVRQLRWPEGVHCPRCSRGQVARDGRDERQPHRQRYRCSACGQRFDDLTGTVFAGHHQPLRVWVLCLYFMGLSLSNRQIAQELGLAEGDSQSMTEQLRAGILATRAPEILTGVVECDEVYVTAGQKGNPGAVAKKNRSGRRRGLRGVPGRGTLDKEKPPIFGMVERGGALVLQMLANVRQATIQPLLRATITPSSLINTDAYDIYARLSQGRGNA